MSVTKRLLDLARANLTDFRAALGRDGVRDLLTDEERAEIERETRDSVGSRAGRAARDVRGAAEDAWERAFEAARQRGFDPGGAASEAERRRWYRTLELSPGAGVEDVRKAYRRLLKVYHPDRHASNPEKYRAATEVTRRITEAHDGLTGYLNR